MKYIFYSLLALAIFTAVPVLADSSLAIRNQSPREIINILVTPDKGKEFFMRLDLAPGHADKVENPDCAGALRVDTGLEFWLFDHVDLKAASELIFCEEHPSCIVILRQKDGNAEHINGKTFNLVPAPGDRPVCELSRFKPRMAMKDVCAILAPDTPVDDNGSLLAGLGFGGLVWAGRLSPGQKGNAGNPLLEHLELRRPLSEADLNKILDMLFSQGYEPWQAEFPDLDVDFAEIAKQKDLNRENVLRKAIAEFMQNQTNGVAAKNAAYRENDEARILLAPSNLLPALANADAPARDVQLFTLVLLPQSGTLLLDVAAYEADKNS